MIEDWERNGATAVPADLKRLQEEADRAFAKEHTNFVAGMVDGAFALLNEIPPSHIDMGVAGTPIVQCIFEKVKLECKKRPPIPKIEAEIRAGLVAAGGQAPPCEEWIQQLRSFARDNGSGGGA